MAQPDQAPSSSSPNNGHAEASSSSSNTTTNWESNDPSAASTSSSLSPSRSSHNVHGEGVIVEGGEEDRVGDRVTYNYRYTHPDIQIMEHSPHQQQQQQQQNLFGIPYRGNIFFLSDDSSVIRDDTWSCIIVVLTFWFFVSMTLILGVYGTVGLSLGPNSSVLIEASPIFVQSVKVERLDGTSNPRLMLYGLYDSPSLDVVKTWSTTHNASVLSGSNQEWIYFLNQGSEINISYSVNPPSSSVFLIIAEGSEGLSQWLEDPTYPNTTLSWNVIHGNGAIKQHIFNSGSYYVAVGNLNSNDVEVGLDLTVRSLLYDTTEAYYNCSLAYGSCGLSVLFPNGNSVVLTTPGSDEASSSDEWYVKVSYGPRWATYIVGIAGMTAIMFAAFNFLNRFRCYREEETGVQYGEVEPERAPLLQYKDDDLSSWGSSYDSVSADEKDLEEFLAANAIDGKPLKDGENGNNTRRLCAICYDAPRDCFFLPCGHCVACFECGTRIVEAAGTCPMCRRNMKKVRKIFTV